MTASHKVKTAATRMLDIIPEAISLGAYATYENAKKAASIAQIKSQYFGGIILLSVMYFPPDSNLDSIENH
jgi:hypothetical protein